MLEFHKQKPKNPAKTDPEKRIKDFQEIYSQFDNKTSVEHPQVLSMWRPLLSNSLSLE